MYDIHITYAIMKNLHNRKQIIFLLLSSIFIFSITACENSVGHDDHDHDHDADPYGVLLEMDGVELVKQEGTDVVYNNDRSIEVIEGEQSGAVQVRWLNDHSETFLPDTGEGYSLRWSIADEEVLTVVQHDSSEPWTFHFEGKNAGSTSISLLLWHNNHEHFTSLPFDVNVLPAGSSEDSDS